MGCTTPKPILLYTPLFGSGKVVKVGSVNKMDEATLKDFPGWLIGIKEFQMTEKITLGVPKVYIKVICLMHEGNLSFSLVLLLSDPTLFQPDLWKL